MNYFNVVIWAFITDIIDYQEVKTGSADSGTVYAVYSFSRKLGQALAGGLGGFALAAIGYASGAATQDAAVMTASTMWQQSYRPSVIQALRYAYGSSIH